MRIHNSGDKADGGIVLVLAAGIILMFGLVQLFRFLKNYPLPEENINV